MILAGTGHRPTSLIPGNSRGGYMDWVNDALLEIAIEQLLALDPERVISGMAIGWDQVLARAALELDIPFIAAVPFRGQESKWPASSQRNYDLLLDEAQEVVVVSSGSYSPGKMHKRNEWMVNNCHHLLALWNGVPSGGTSSCVAYAQSMQKPVTNVWSTWTAAMARKR